MASCLIIFGPPRWIKKIFNHFPCGDGSKKTYFQNSCICPQEKTNNKKPYTKPAFKTLKATCVAFDNTQWKLILSGIKLICIHWTTIQLSNSYHKFKKENAFPLKLFLQLVAEKLRRAFLIWLATSGECLFLWKSWILLCNPEANNGVTTRRSAQ